MRKRLRSDLDAIAVGGDQAAAVRAAKQARTRALDALEDAPLTVRRRLHGLVHEDVVRWAAERRLPAAAFAARSPTAPSRHAGAISLALNADELRLATAIGASLPAIAAKLARAIPRRNGAATVGFTRQELMLLLNALRDGPTPAHRSLTGSLERLTGRRQPPPPGTPAAPRTARPTPRGRGGPPGRQRPPSS